VNYNLGDDEGYEESDDEEFDGDDQNNNLKKANIRAYLIQDDDYNDIKGLRVLKFTELSDGNDHHE